MTSAQVRDRFKISDTTLFRWTRDASLKFPQTDEGKAAQTV
jgi:predicted site-specific integrase-resolvase